MTHAWPFIILVFAVAVVFFMAGYLFSRIDAEDEMLEDAFEWNCEIECIITELEQTINSGQYNDAVKYGMEKALNIVEAHRRDYR